MENSQDIRKLLDLYFDGDTSLEQEEMLRKMFSSGKFPPELECYRPLFCYVDMERKSTDAPRKWNVRRFIAATLCAAAVFAAAGLFILAGLSGDGPDFLLTVGEKQVNDEALAVMIVDRELEQLRDVHNTLDLSMDALRQSAEIRDSAMKTIDGRITLDIKLK